MVLIRSNQISLLPEMDPSKGVEVEESTRHSWVNSNNLKNENRLLNSLSIEKISLNYCYLLPELMP